MLSSKKRDQRRRGEKISPRVGVTLKLAGQLGGGECLLLHHLFFVLAPSLIKPSLSHFLQVYCLAAGQGQLYGWGFPPPSQYLTFAFRL